MSCSASESNITPSSTAPPSPETEVQPIELRGPAAGRNAQISGMAWYGEILILAPQYPLDVGNTLFAVPKSELMGVIEGEQEPISPLAIRFDATGIRDLPGYEGLESIVFEGDRVFVTVEADLGADMTGYLLSGQIEPDLSSISIDATSPVLIPAQAPIDNFSDEAMLLYKDRLYTFYEANGANVNPSPVAHRFQTDLVVDRLMSFPNVEYRITDVTQPDESGRFWAINYFFPGDIRKLDLVADPIAARFGEGETHQGSDVVERLIEFQIGEDGISMTDTPPLQLVLLEDEVARNWEGIVRFGDLGFLIVTDTFPETILGFVETE